MEDAPADDHGAGLLRLRGERRRGGGARRGRGGAVRSRPRSLGGVRPRRPDPRDSLRRGRDRGVGVPGGWLPRGGGRGPERGPADRARGAAAAASRVRARRPLPRGGGAGRRASRGGRSLRGSALPAAHALGAARWPVAAPRGCAGAGVDEVRLPGGGGRRPLRLHRGVRPRVLPVDPGADGSLGRASLTRPGRRTGPRRVRSGPAARRRS